jgi:phosphoesterase RecJ-like protein
VTVCTRALLDEVGADDTDLEGVVDMLQHTSGVDLGVVVVERKNTRTKLSLRSSGRVDVAALARRLSPGGGGHAKAAGASIDAPFGEVLARLDAEADALFR